MSFNIQLLRVYSIVFNLPFRFYFLYQDYSSKSSAFAIVVLTFFICGIVSSFVFTALILYRRLKGGRQQFTTVPHSTDINYRANENVAFPMQQQEPPHITTGVSRDDDDDDDDGSDDVSYEDDEIDYETHLRTIT